MEFITNIDLINKSTTAYTHIIWSMSVGGFIMLYILITRVKQRITYILTKKFRERIKASIAILNDSELYDENSINESYNTLSACAQKSGYLAQYMLDEFISLEDNLDIPVHLLRQLSEGLNLRKVALTKLMEGDVSLVLKGINELKIVGGSDDVYLIQGFLCHHGMEVRRATRITIAALKPQEALSCLTSLMDELDSYEKASLYRSVEKLPFGQMPDFSTYLNCSSESALCFIIDLVTKFHQRDAVSQIRALTLHQSHKVNICATEALKSLQDGKSISIAQGQYMTA